MARLLVVEDDPDLAQILSGTFKEAGHSVQTVSTGENALKAFSQRPPDLVLVDVLLPDIDGFTLVARIRRTSSVPILMLTAKGSVEDQIRGLEGGADDYVVKPFRFPVLLARVRALLRRGATAPIQCGPLVVDFGAKEVTVAGRPVYLSATERSLLEFLAMNVGRTVTKAEILERVWQDGDRATNVVEVYINYLRQKLERNLSHRLIYTVRGKGYRLNSKEIL